MADTKQNPAQAARASGANGSSTIDRRRNDSREKLKTAAIKLFYERGYEATSIRTIVTACGLTAPAFYNHFETKDDLLREIIHEGHEQAGAMMEAALEASDPSPTDRLRRLIGTYVRFHTQHQLRALVVNSEFRCLPEPHLSDTQAERLKLRDMIEGVVREGVEAGEFDVSSLGDDEHAVRLATIAIGDMSLRVATWFRTGGDLDHKDVETVYANFALRIVGASLD